jgi:hypothetical protein
MGFAGMKWSWVVRDGHAIRCHEALEVYPFIRCWTFDVRCSSGHEVVKNGQEIEKGNRDSERGLRPVGPTLQRERGMNLRQSASSADKNEE